MLSGQTDESSCESDIQAESMLCARNNEGCYSLPCSGFHAGSIARLIRSRDNSVAFRHRGD